MIRRVAKTAGIMTLAVLPLLADFSYQEKSTITGGAMASLMKIAGVFSKQAREPIESTVSVKGDRMVTRGRYRATIIDLNSQTITEVDLQKKTYSVMTFDQMKAMLEQLQQNMKQSKNSADQPQMEFKVSAKDTGSRKEVSGYDAKEMLLRMELQGTDQQTGQKGGMVITSDMWIAPSIEGYAEIRQFHKHMAEKLNWAPGSNMFAARPEVSQGMSELYKEAGKLDGMPVMQTVVMGADTQQPAGSSQQQTPPPEQQQPAARPSFGGLLGGALGVQRNKKSSSDPPPNKDSQPGSLLEMTTVMSGFSAAPVDDSLFAVPSGFKQVQPDSRKMQ